MPTRNHEPSYITFTGLDRREHIESAGALSAIYPIEWGVLVDDAQAGTPLFPDNTNLEAIRRSGLRLSAHICGNWAKGIVQGREIDLDLSGFSRIQINHGFEGSTEAQIANSQAFGAKRGVRPALQCQGKFPSDARVDWLFDVSFGKGLTPKSFPKVTHSYPFCGISGSLGPITVAAVLDKLEVELGTPYWIDMESRIRTEGELDISKCRAVCEAVYGKR